jgi:hypothetical protein
MKRTIILLALAPFLFGACSLLFTHGPPVGHEKMVYFSCSESNTGPVLDIVWGALNVAGALVIAGHRDEYDHPDQSVATGVVWGIISGISAGVGFDRVKKCQAAKRQLAERQASAPAHAEQAAPGRAAEVAGVQTVLIQSGDDTLTIGQPVQFAAKAFDANGAVVRNVTTFRWSSSNDAVASVSDAGLVTPRAAGTAVIAANSYNVVGTKRIVVGRQGPGRQAREPSGGGGNTEVERVEITPGTDTVMAGNSIQLVAKALDRNGAFYINAAFRWSSSNDAVASVSNSGLVTAHAPGTVVIAANVDNVVGTASVVVSP